MYQLNQKKKEKVKYVRSSTNDGAIGWMAGRIRFSNPRGLAHSMWKSISSFMKRMVDGFEDCKRWNNHVQLGARTFESPLAKGLPHPLQAPLLLAAQVTYMRVTGIKKQVSKIAAVVWYTYSSLILIPISQQ